MQRRKYFRWSFIWLVFFIYVISAMRFPTPPQLQGTFPMTTGTQECDTHLPFILQLFCLPPLFWQLTVRDLHSTTKRTFLLWESTSCMLPCTTCVDLSFFTGFISTKVWIDRPIPKYFEICYDRTSVFLCMGALSIWLFWFIPSCKTCPPSDNIVATAAHKGSFNQGGYRDIAIIPARVLTTFRTHFPVC